MAWVDTNNYRCKELEVAIVLSTDSSLVAKETLDFLSGFTVGGNMFPSITEEALQRMTSTDYQLRHSNFLAYHTADIKSRYSDVEGAIVATNPSSGPYPFVPGEDFN